MDTKIRYQCVYIVWWWTGNWNRWNVFNQAFDRLFGHCNEKKLLQTSMGWDEDHCSEEPVVDSVGARFYLCDLMCKRRRVCYRYSWVSLAYKRRDTGYCWIWLAYIYDTGSIYLFILRHTVTSQITTIVYVVCHCYSRRVATTLDCGPGGPWFKSEWVPIFYEARSTTGLTSAVVSSVFYMLVPEPLNIKTVTGACKMIDGCSL